MFCFVLFSILNKAVITFFFYIPDWIRTCCVVQARLKLAVFLLPRPRSAGVTGGLSCLQTYFLVSSCLALGLSFVVHFLAYGLTLLIPSGLDGLPLCIQISLSSAVPLPCVPSLGTLLLSCILDELCVNVVCHHKPCQNLPLRIFYVPRQCQSLYI